MDKTQAERPENELPDRERTPLTERRDWEVFQENESDVTERLRIAGGWLYRTIVGGTSVGLVFVPAADGAE